MKVIDEATLDRYRHKLNCEWCGAICTPHPHHWKARGMGSAWRLDIDFNLVALDFVCHDKAHRGNINRHDLLEVIAKREGVPAEDIQQTLWDILRLPKGTDIKEAYGLIARTKGRYANHHRRTNSQMHQAS